MQKPDELPSHKSPRHGKVEQTNGRELSLYTPGSQSNPPKFESSVRGFVFDCYMVSGAIGSEAQDRDCALQTDAPNRRAECPLRVIFVDFGISAACRVRG